LKTLHFRFAQLAAIRLRLGERAMSTLARLPNGHMNGRESQESIFGWKHRLRQQEAITGFCLSFRVCSAVCGF
jgi:hypothetical protein